MLGLPFDDGVKLGVVVIFATKGNNRKEKKGILGGDNMMGIGVMGRGFV